MKSKFSLIHLESELSFANPELRLRTKQGWASIYNYNLGSRVLKEFRKRRGASNPDFWLTDEWVSLYITTKK